MNQSNSQVPNKSLRHEIVAIRRGSLDDMWGENAIEKQLQIMQIQVGVATIPIYGPLRQRAEWSGTDYCWIQAQLQKALSNQAITQINLEIDSPGGEVLGISELAEFIYASRKIKPIMAIVKNMACSAAYWIASACSKIVLAGETTITGSIGVLAIHVDESAVDQTYRGKITEIASGKFKNIASPNAPLSADGQAYLKDQVDYLYSTFVQSIAKYRGMDVNKVIAVADGREYIGSQAIGLGLADSIQTTIKGESSMATVEELQQEVDKLKKELEDEKNKNKQAPAEQSAHDQNQTLAQAIQKAQAEERSRLLALDEIDHGGVSHDIVMQAKREGTTPEQAAMQILRSQGNMTKNFRSAMREETVPIIASTNVPTSAEKMNETVAAMVAGAKQYSYKEYKGVGNHGG